VTNRPQGAAQSGIRRCRAWTALLALGVLCLGGCMVGPQYVRPAAEVPASYAEGGVWKPAQPNDAVAKGSWWDVFDDPQLNALEEQINVSNQTLRVAQDRFLQARAAVRISRSGLFPSVTGGASVTPTHQSSHRPLFNGSSVSPNYTDYILRADVSYEADVWGSVRRTIEASRSEAQASAADLANVNLSLHAELALDYFQLRGLDAQKQLFDSTVAAFEKALSLTETRHNAGLASAVDVAQAQTLLETTRAQATDLGVQRAAFEHAIAVLIGKPASSFHLQPLPLSMPPPSIPPGAPSYLLERRPDIAAAERRMQEANAQIGVARAAYFPLISLTGSGGLESAALGTLLQGPSAFGELIAAATQTLFDAGRRHAVSDQAKAAYDQSVATYRQTLLVALQEVADNLAALEVLANEAKQEDVAVESAQHSVALSLTRYRGGLTSYLEVVTAQSLALSDERTAVDILTRRMAASVLLAKAIGGGWNVSQIPRL
jgi:NodT family efflux transporter outer membrane factor (OMF) lipoprotein